MLRKVLIGLGVFLLLLIATAIALPFIFKDKINALVKEEINKNLNARVDYADYGLTLISSFPNFTLTLDNLSVVGIDNFKGDTLAAVKHTAVTIDLMSMFKGEKYKLLAFKLEEPVLHAIVDYDGKANWDIVKPSTTSTTTEQSKFALEAKKVQITDGELSYEDRKGGAVASIHDLDFEGSGDVTQDIYDLTTKTNIAALSFKNGLVSYLSKAKLEAIVNLSIDNRVNKYTFKDNSINLNDLGLQFDGYVQTQKEDLNLDVNFKSKKTEFKSILSLLPAVYAKDFDKIKTSGTLDLKGSVKGLYNVKTYPAFNLDWKVGNAMFQYPDLPVAVRNINIVSTVVKPQGSLDLTVVDIPKLHFEAGSDPVDAKINVKTPVSDPNVSADIHGTMNLANVPKFYPMEGVKSMAGLLKLNLLFKGRKSDLDKKNYEAITAAGDANISGLYYDSKDLPMPVRVNSMQMNFSPQNIKLSNLVAVVGHTDLNASGTLDNFMSYLFGKGDLVGTLNLKSGVFDANEWLSKDADAPVSNTATKDTSHTQFFKVPAQINFTANSEFGKIFYDKIVLQNVKGEVVVKDEAIHLNNLFANLLGGSATISADYVTKNLNNPDVSFTYDIKDFDIQQTYKAVDLSSKMAPVIKHINGAFSSDLKGSGKLNPDMSVDYKSLTGDGKVQLTNAKITGLPMLAEITKVAKIPALQNLELKDGWTVLKFKDGKVNVDPTDFKFGNGYNINFKGANGFDQTIDYDVRLDVPSKELGPATSVAQSMLAKVPGVSATMPDVVGFLFKVTGPFSKPQVKLNKVTAGGSSVKDVLTDTANDLKKQAEEEAKKKADELKKQAEDQFNKQKQAAQEAADKARKEAEQKAREAAEKAKKEAEDKLKNVIKWPK